MLNKDPHRAQEQPRCFHLRDGCDLRDACSDCMLLAQSLYAARLETPPMGDHLIQRLRAVAGTQPLDFEQDPMELSSEDDLESTVHELLSDTFEQSHRTRPMPPTLAHSLRAIASDPSAKASAHGASEQGRSTPRAALPWWLADLNWATAACALLTAALTLMAGDSSARFQDLTRLQDQGAVQRLGSIQGLPPLQDLAPDLASVQDLLRFTKLPSEAKTTTGPTEPTPAASSPDWLTSARTSGAGAWKGIRDRVVARVDPWIGRVHGRIEAFRTAADAWLGRSSKSTDSESTHFQNAGSAGSQGTGSENTPTKTIAPLGPEQLQELKLRAREAWNDSKPTPEAGRTRHGKEAP